MELKEIARCEAWTDEQVVERVLAGETGLYEIIMRRYNQRLYRVVRAILRDDDETEDVMQDAYVRAYQHLRQFESRAAFSTWVTRIAVHEALARLRRRNRFAPLENADEDGEILVNAATPFPDPEQSTSQSEITQMLEKAILALPEPYRTVLMLRDVEEMSTADTATSLSISEENVKVRLHRGRALIRKALYARAGAQARTAFAFMGARCDRVVERVFARLAEPAQDNRLA
jgi:RNA polymerase sigma-70 factor, ECF subfamily